MSATIDLTTKEMAAAIASKALSPVEAVEGALRRIEARESQVRAWAYVDGERALEAARKLEAEAASGQLRGPLHGVPVGIKDVFHAEGMPTVSNSKTMNPNARYPDSGIAAYLKAAGAIVLGKCETVEFAGMGIPPESRNVWNHAHTGGGSSSGSGVAVGARMVPATIGTQTGGSNLRPAAYNGIAGLKPTYGAFSRAGLLPVSWTLDHPGLITRSAGDLELIFTALAKRKPAPAAAPGKWRIGVLREFFFETSEADTQKSVDGALAQIADAGHSVVELPLPEIFAAQRAIHNLIMSPEMAVYHAPRMDVHRDTMTEKHRLNAEAFSLLPNTYYIQALRARRVLRDAMAALFAEVDVLAMPTAPAGAPFGLESTGNASFLSPWSLVGFPATTVPTGLADNGLPLGLQFVGAPGTDVLVCRAATMAEGLLGRLTLPD